MQEIGELRIAGILDNLTQAFLSRECKLLNLGRLHWQEEMEQFQPQLLFVESAWSGIHNEWYQKVSMKSKELTELIKWCKDHGVPTVFWNKEDPIHFNVFIEAAKLFDWVFTTEFDCIPLYKRFLKHERIGLLPFATSPALFTPIEEFERQEAVCFAGSYYRTQKERCRDFDRMYSAVSKVRPCDIYERNIYPGDTRYRFPERYAGNIIGTLPIDHVSDAYKKYEFNITINTAKTFSTMEGRRVFELLSSNTLVISNECRGIENLFGDIVLYCREEEAIAEEITGLINNKEELFKRRLAGLRKVLAEHTYGQRLSYICEKALGERRQQEPLHIIVFTVASSIEELETVYEMFCSQTYANKELIVLARVCDLAIKMQKDKKVRFLEYVGENALKQLGEADYYAYLSPSNYYGKNYVLDCMLATKYSKSKIIGKGCYFTYEDGEAVKKETSLKYRNCSEIFADRCVISREESSSITVSQVAGEEKKLSGKEIMAIDEYNFLEGAHGKEDKAVTDKEMDCGYLLKEIYEAADLLTDDSRYYTIQKRLTGREVLLHLRTNKQHGDEWTIISNPKMEEAVIRVVNVPKKQNIFYEQRFLVKEYEVDGYLYAYFGGETQGGALLRIAYLDKSGNVVIQYQIPPTAYKRLPIPKNAEYFTIGLFASSNSSVTIREILINAFCKPGIFNSIIEEGKKHSE